MRLVLAIAALAAPLLTAAPAAAQAAWSAGEFERGFGMGYEGFDTPITVGTRDENGNRLVVDGRIMSETSLYGGLGDSGYGDSLSGSAIGNQLTVVTQGSWNTVIIDSTQINNGNVSAVINGEDQ